MHRKVAAALVAVLALGAASCGESKPLTRAELVRRADAICTRVEREGERFMRSVAALSKGTGQLSATDRAALQVKAAAAIQREATQLDGLVAPDELKSAMDQFVTMQRQRSERIRKGITRSPEVEIAFAHKSARIARRLGFRVCT